MGCNTTFDAHPITKILFHCSIRPTVFPAYFQAQVENPTFSLQVRFLLYNSEEDQTEIIASPTSTHVGIVCFLAKEIVLLLV
jgi:hypothetical protein